MSGKDALAVLKKVPLFSDLEADELREVIRQTSLVHVPPGRTIFSDGDPGDALYVVVVGEVEIVKKVPTGGTRVLAALKPRAVFGEMSLLTEETRSASAVAKDKCSLLKIDRTAFRERLARGELVALKMTAHLATIMAGRLRAMDEELVKLLAEESGRPERTGTTVPLYDLEEARDKVMFQWKL